MTELNFALLKWQQEVFKDKHRFKVVAAGRRAPALGEHGSVSSRFDFCVARAR
jgi:hypothetical protein